MTEVQMAIRAWIESNPLRRFRRSKRLTIADTAAAVGVSNMTVQYWENGSTSPTDENMGKIARLMERPVEDLEREWGEWAAARPGV